MSEELLRVENLKKYFPIQAGFFKRTVGHVKAVDDISFTINRGETLSLVGESGCGKSTTGRTILKLLEATEGKVYFDGKDVYSLNRKEMKDIRKEMQIIFQDPYSSLNPRMTVMQTISEGMRYHNLVTRDNMQDRVKEVLEMSGLSAYHMNRYPHEFSGGQRQRIGIARALSLNPSFIVADEPVSALDVSIQAQVINLMMDLKEKLDLSYLFISHDLGVVKHMSDRIGVMYLGSLVELTDKKSLYASPKHPYTKALLNSIPVKNPRARKENVPLEGDIPSPANPPSGCKFHTRCPYATAECKEVIPKFEDKGNGHFVACHLVK